jgi:hypothetical protein
MTRHLWLRLLLVLGLPAAVGCDESAAPTQPDGASTPAPAPPASAQASNRWTMLAAHPGPEYREFAIGVVPNSTGQPIVYALGGTDEQGGSCFATQTFNVATNTWSGTNAAVCGQNGGSWT